MAYITKVVIGDLHPIFQSKDPTKDTLEGRGGFLEPDSIREYLYVLHTDTLSCC